MNRRELKFRAWNGFELQYSDKFNSLEAFWAVTDDAGYGDFKTIWTQFTGLKDKNNREIYEGDIIKVNNKYNDIHSVKFDNGSFCIIADGDSQDNVLLSSVLECEIIGNIFENKELVKQ